MISPVGEHPMVQFMELYDGGEFAPAALRRMREDIWSRPLSAASLREAMFSMLGDGWRGRVPVVVEKIVELEPGEFGFIGCIDDSEVLSASDGSTLHNVTFPKVRTMVWVPLTTEQALEWHADPRKRVVAIDPLGMLVLGPEDKVRDEVGSFTDEDDE
jgi:hypothetical protein